jgi:type IV pilus assembly protein PilB
MEERDKKVMLGQVLVREGLVTEKQLQKALAEQARKESYLPLGEMCVHQKYLSKADLQKVLRKHRSHIYLGDLLVNLGLLGQEDLLQVLEFQQIDGKRVGRLLIEHGLITEANLLNALSMQLGIPKLTPSPGIVQPSVLKGISKAFLVKHNCLPVYQDGESVTVIMSDPLSEETLQSLEKIYRCRIEPAVASSEEIQKGIRMIFDDLKLTDRPVEDRPLKQEQRRLVIDDSTATAHSDDNTVEVTNFIITEAVNDGATDIHIEPTENCLHVRFRVDGILRHKTDLPTGMAIPLTSRFKALSGLDISDTRRHQDGRLGARIGGKTYDFRISTYPAIFGESMVIRILRNQSSIMELEMLGFSPTQLELYKQLLAVPTGVTLVTGPTGNGKTTTLYASLLHLRAQDKKILTVEEPVEYTMDGVIQGQVSEKTGLTYDTFVRSMLRQDPDVIMVGEMRDTASARAVVESCVAGHKVLTSCHTEEASGALLRMYSAGIETFMISSTVMAVFSQRLVRTLCPHCKSAYAPSPEVLASFRSIVPLNAEAYTFFAPQGCTECENTGYSGRTALSEMLMVNNEIRDGIMSRVPTAKIRAIARRSSGLLSLQEDGFYKATRGITSLEEVLRILSCNDGDATAPYSSEEIVSLSEAGSRAYLASGRSTSASRSSGSLHGGAGHSAETGGASSSIYSTQGASR